MQESLARRSNRERSEETRKKLMEAARRLFVEKTYAETGTPEIVAAAGVTRGALYHHFADKQALFRAVVEREAAQVAEVIERETEEEASPIEALIKGGETFLAAMATPGRTRLLLLDGPAVLGRQVMDDIDGRNGNRTLKEGLAAAMQAGALRELPLDPLTHLLGAAYDRAALAAEAGADAAALRVTLAALLQGLAAPPAPRP